MFKKPFQNTSLEIRKEFRSGRLESRTQNQTQINLKLEMMSKLRSAQIQTLAKRGKLRSHAVMCWEITREVIVYLSRWTLSLAPPWRHRNPAIVSEAPLILPSCATHSLDNSNQLNAKANQWTLEWIMNEVMSKNCEKEIEIEIRTAMNPIMNHERSDLLISVRADRCESHREKGNGNEKSESEQEAPFGKSWIKNDLF